jgi:hypothetical protein
MELNIEFFMTGPSLWTMHGSRLPARSFLPIGRHEGTNVPDINLLATFRLQFGVLSPGYKILLLLIRGNVVELHGLDLLFSSIMHCMTRLASAIARSKIAPRQLSHFNIFVVE